MSCLVPIPSEADKALLIIQKQLAESLVAVYLHGSAVAGGLRPRSDVDLLVIIDRPMTSVVRECLAADLMIISGRYPSDPDGRRPVELIVFCAPILLYRFIQPDANSFTVNGYVANMRWAKFPSLFVIQN
ncbi:nucleotidyltransferase domain-containing protein [Xenorhabdus siamensis]|uniref:nucleotidyltransferase domain-containing protein n=1 Tax=Xenorhabdus siamensis TaxID=3136254 RepID=UPI0030F39517